MTPTAGTPQSEYSTGFYSTEGFNKKIDLNKLPIIKVDFRTDSSNSYTYLGLEGSGKSLGLEYKSNEIKVKLNDGNNISYPNMAVGGAQVGAWYTAEFELSPTEAKVYVYPQGGTKPPAFTYNISNWSPGLRFYNRNGNTNIDNVNVSVKRQTFDYAYDNLNRLTKVTNNAESSTVEYSYDTLGNRTNKKINGIVQYDYQYNVANELEFVKDSNNNNLIDFDYDANGNTTKMTDYRPNPDEITNYYYDQNNNLVKVVKPNGDKVEFVYDGQGNRYSKIVTPNEGQANTTYYQYDDGGNIVLETYKDEQQQTQVKVKYIRDTGGKALSMEQNNQMYYYFYNAHGDVTGLTDSSGNVVASYSYNEFGNLASSTGTIYNPLRYSGANNAYFDEEIGIYKMGVRYYNPEVGRWITRDSYKGELQKPQSQNRYIYVGNNPLNSIDPSGNKSKYIKDYPPEIKQSTEIRCWVAVIRMIVAAKKKYTPTEDDVLDKVDHNGNDEADEISFDQLIQGLKDYGLKGINSSDSSAMSWANVKANVDGNKFAIPIIDWNTGGSHTILIKGYDPVGKYVIYNDPGDGKGHKRKYDTIKTKFKGRIDTGKWGASIWNIHN